MEYNETQERLRETLLGEAKDSVRGLEGRDDIRAAILTGSAAWGKPNPDGDIDILLITRGGDGVCYRYLIPRFSPVRRRTEHGFIPRLIVEDNIEKAFGTRISCSMIEQLRNGRVLFQKEAEGDELVDRARGAVPGRFVIGAFIKDCKDALDELSVALGGNRRHEVVLAARRITRIAARALLLARDRTAVSKEKHEYRAVRRCFDARERGEYEALMGTADIEGEEARRVLDRSIEILRWVVEGKSVSTGLVRYD
ncbi:MAG TPA: hypothetical protein VMX58_13280 [Patescibacteria group bacterium]|nr:hypothetical protein [Patescibacteria group bacterium]